MFLNDHGAKRGRFDGHQGAAASPYGGYHSPAAAPSTSYGGYSGGGAGRGDMPPCNTLFIGNLSDQVRLPADPAVCSRDAMMRAVPPASDPFSHGAATQVHSHSCPLRLRQQMNYCTAFVAGRGSGVAGAVRRGAGLPAGEDEPGAARHDVLRGVQRRRDRHGGAPTAPGVLPLLVSRRHHMHNQAVVSFHGSYVG